MAIESKHVKAFRERHAQPGEAVLAWAEGYIGEMMGTGDKTQHNGVFIVTESRAIFYRKGIIGEVLETMPLKRLTSVERKSTLGHRVIRLHTSHDELEFKTFDKNGETNIVNAIEAGRSEEDPSEQGSSGGLDPLEILNKLGELKESGLITQDEFDQKKAEILGKM